MIETIYKIYTYTIFFLLVIKAILYLILDTRNNHPIQYGSAWGMSNFEFYKKIVSPKDGKLKQRVNLLHLISMVGLFLLIIVHLYRLVSN
jgi:hypothetical protein